MSCILPGANLEGAAPIFAAVAESFSEGGEDRRFSVGLAELREGDTPDGLVARADTALYEARSRAGHRRHGRPNDLAASGLAGGGRLAPGAELARSSRHVEQASGCRTAS